MSQTRQIVPDDVRATVIALMQREGIIRASSMLHVGTETVDKVILRIALRPASYRRVMVGVERLGA